MSAFRLSGPLSAVRAVTEAIAALGIPPQGAWTLRELPCGRVEIHSAGRGYSVARDWRRAVEAHLAAPVPLASIRVGPWGRRR